MQLFTIITKGKKQIFNKASKRVLFYCCETRCYMIEVTFINDYKYTTSNPVYLWDYGLNLNIYGLNTTDEVIQVHFADNSCERTIVRLASKYADYYQVSIPVIARNKTEGFTLLKL